MARIDRLVTPSVQVFPLEIPTQTIQQQSGFPRAVVEVNAPLQAVAAPGSGNYVQIYQDYVLPKNFAYLYLSSDMSLSHDTETTMDDTHQPFQIILGNVAESRTYITPLKQTDPAADQSSTQARWFLYTDPSNQYGTTWWDPNPTKDVIFNDKSENVRVKNYVSNTNTGGSGTSFLFSYRARFLQIDLSQAYAFAINNTLATR
jgi:hypothetical protein